MARPTHSSVLAFFAYRYLWRIRRGWRPLRLRKQDNLIWVSDNEDKLAIVERSRWGRYRRGITTKTTMIAADYGVPQFVELRGGDLVVDAGANIGEFAIYAARAGARVIAIEPDADTLPCLRANVAGLEVEIIPVCLWDSDRPLTLYRAAETADTSAVNKSEQQVTVDARRLDSLLPMLGDRRIRLIKCDAEGAEPEVLRGASRTLLRTEYISLDCGAERGAQTTLAACEELLVAAGFEIIRRQAAGRCNLIGRNEVLFGEP